MFYKKHFLIESSCGCNKGKIRGNNEDNFYFNGEYLPEENEGIVGVITSAKETSEPVCFAVFDGMGGEVCGEVASFTAARMFKKYTESVKKISEKDLKELCLEINNEIITEAERIGRGRIGSTAAILCFYHNKVYICNIGDSKIFVLRNNRLMQLSVDHTDEDIMKKLGVSRKKYRLTQHFGIYPSEMIIEPYISLMDVQPGDIYLLCSDGLTDMVDEDKIEGLLETDGSSKDKVSILMKEALENGGRDNITVVVGCIKT